MLPGEIKRELVQRFTQRTADRASASSGKSSASGAGLITPAGSQSATSNTHCHALQQARKILAISAMTFGYQAMGSPRAATTASAKTARRYNLPLVAVLILPASSRLPLRCLQGWLHCLLPADLHGPLLGQPNWHKPASASTARI